MTKRGGTVVLSQHSAQSGSSKALPDSSGVDSSPNSKARNDKSDWGNLRETGGIERKLEAAIKSAAFSRSFHSHSARRLASYVGQDDRIKSVAMESSRRGEQRTEVSISASA